MAGIAPDHPDALREHAPRIIGGALLHEQHGVRDQRRGHRRDHQHQRGMRIGLARPCFGLRLGGIVVSAGEQRGQHRGIEARAAGRGGHRQQQRRQPQATARAAHRTISWP
ncbi:MAG: hypothetical protein U1F30_00115 [Steroidobacteraceae bacterium]